jgi:hypothetical protein
LRVSSFYFQELTSWNLITLVGFDEFDLAV